MPSHVFFYVGAVSLEIGVVILTFGFLNGSAYTIPCLIIDLVDPDVVRLPFLACQELVANTDEFLDVLGYPWVES